MRFFKANPDRLEHYHRRRRWARRLNLIMLGLALTAVLGSRRPGGTSITIF